ncbi:hypothetical protein EKK58_00400 [Candidatus Dependentiae bacterium]|nr:MAG: hypothetical protein EKK58_00400 [Candidatus Dependentiae bacterium]
MPVKIQHAYAIGDRVTLVSGRTVYITKLRKTPGADVQFAPIRNQPWYEGFDSSGTTHQFPQTSVTHKFSEGYPLEIKPRVPRVLKAQARRRATKIERRESITIEWPVEEETTGSEERYEQAADRIYNAIVNDMPSGIADKLFYKLLEFAVDFDEITLVPDECRPQIRRFLKRVRTNQAALR